MIEALLMPMMLLISLIIPIQLLCAIGGIVAAFYNPILGFVITSVPVVVLLLTWLWGKAIPAPEYIPELSPLANDIHKRFRAYFVAPLAGRNCSGAASGIMLSLIPVTIISCFRGFWWGIAIGAVLLLIVAPFQRAFNPTNFLTEDEKTAFDELLDFKAK